MACQCPPEPAGRQQAAIKQHATLGCQPLDALPLELVLQPQVTCAVIRYIGYMDATGECKACNAQVAGLPKGLAHMTCPNMTRRFAPLTMSCLRLPCHTKMLLLSHAVTKRCGFSGWYATPHTSPVCPCISGSGSTLAAAAADPGLAVLAADDDALMPPVAAAGSSSQRSQQCVPSSSSLPPRLTSSALKLAGPDWAGCWNCSGQAGRQMRGRPGMQRHENWHILQSSSHDLLVTTLSQTGLHSQH